MEQVKYYSPVVRCLTCGKERNPEWHERAENPVEAAKKFLKRNCEVTGKVCNLQYRCGLILGKGNDISL